MAAKRRARKPAPRQAGYAFADGSPFPVDWPDPQLSAGSWLSDLGRRPSPVSWLEASARALGMPALRGCFEEVGLQTPQPLSLERYANGWAYRPQFDERAYLVENQNALERFVAGSGGIKALWETRSLLRVRARCEKLGTYGAAAPLSDLFADAFYAMGQIELAGLALSSAALPLQELLAAEFEQEGLRLFGELVQGYENPSLAVDERVWSLAQRAKHNPPLLRALQATRLPTLDELASLDRSGDFRLNVGVLMSQIGRSAYDYDLMSETTQERADVLLSLVRRFLQGDAPAPERMLKLAAARRQARLSEVDSSVPPGQAMLLRKLVSEMAVYVPLRQSLAAWRLAVYGALRLALLRIGRRLAEWQLLEWEGDIFLLTAEELEAVKGGEDLKSVIHLRRAEHRRRAASLPPDCIGVAVETPAPPLAADALCGIGASSGERRGCARVLRSVEEGWKLGAGDVIVAVTSLPPWSALFGIAGAVVTEAGGMLSHTAMLSREYGIPCVVGAKGATTRIKDGDSVLVNGVSGTIFLSGQTG